LYDLLISHRVDPRLCVDCCDFAFTYEK
jgi:hypothetical protein